MDKQPDRVFRFTVDLTLLTEHHVSIQETPSLCVELLGKALAQGSGSVDAYQQYALCSSDLMAYTAPRRALAEARGKRQWVRPRTAASAASQPFSQAWGGPPTAS